jgi:hypothetical protein
MGIHPRDAAKIRNSRSWRRQKLKPKKRYWFDEKRRRHAH